MAEKQQSAGRKSPAPDDLKTWMAARFSTLEGQIEGTKHQNINQDKTLNEIKQGLEQLNGEVFEIKQQYDGLVKENSAMRTTIDDQNMRILQLEAQTRKDNLRFYNIPETRNKTAEEDLRDFMRKNLRLEPRNIDLSTVYRVGVANVMNNRPRCILARFIHGSDRDSVKAAAVNLKGTRFGISEDLPPEWARIRREAYLTHIREAKQQGKRVRWRGPKLFIEGVEIDLRLGNDRIPSASQARRTNTAQKKQSHQPQETSRSSNSDSDGDSEQNPPSPLPQRETDRSRRRERKKRVPKLKKSKSNTSNPNTSNRTLTQSRVDIQERLQALAVTQKDSDIELTGTETAEDRATASSSDPSPSGVTTRSKQRLGKFAHKSD